MKYIIRPYAYIYYEILLEVHIKNKKHTQDMHKNTNTVTFFDNLYFYI